MSETGSYCTNILLGDSKKALISLSVPMMIAMLIMSLYNVVDAIWVSGLGSLALAATGFVAPFYMIIYGIGEGLGMGAGSAIARHIGENNHSDANNAGNHALILTIIVSIISAIVFFLFSDSLFDLIGAGEAAALASDYAVIVCGLGIFTIYSNVIAAVLRSEGDAKRSMYALIAGGILNIFLDPVLIYILGWGIAGAAWATVISVALSSVILYYWTMIKKDTYVRYNLKFFSFKKRISFRYFKGRSSCINRAGIHVDNNVCYRSDSRNCCNCQCSGSVYCRFQSPVRCNVPPYWNRNCSNVN
ncbi:MATE family efflux transporter [Methanolacinia petrolearia]|uniref:MATE family efflux transporter n=1 Tax=Methanolacinia petrolearia TaxID=54120 RepID=UPI003BAC3C1B